jgi:hypothetical protein
MVEIAIAAAAAMTNAVTRYFLLRTYRTPFFELGLTRLIIYNPRDLLYAKMGPMVLCQIGSSQLTSAENLTETIQSNRRLFGGDRA